MKRTYFLFLAILVVTSASAAFAQSFNGTAPAGTTLTDPGQTSNNLNTPRNTASTANANGTLPAAAAPASETATTTVTTSSPSADNGTAKDMVAPPGTTVSTTTTAVSTSDKVAAGGSDVPATAEVPATAAKQLPRTASNLPLIAVLGLLGLGAGFAVRSASKA
jgi:hypothetical protein